MFTLPIQIIKTFEVFGGRKVEQKVKLAKKKKKIKAITSTAF